MNNLVQKEIDGLRKDIIGVGYAAEKLFIQGKGDTKVIAFARLKIKVLDSRLDVLEALIDLAYEPDDEE